MTYTLSDDDYKYILEDGQPIDMTPWGHSELYYTDEVTGYIKVTLKNGVVLRDSNDFLPAWSVYTGSMAKTGSGSVTTDYGTFSVQCTYGAVGWTGQPYLRLSSNNSIDLANIGRIEFRESHEWSDTITILSQPEDKTVEYGKPFILTVVAKTTEGDLHYQWYKKENGVNVALEGKTGPTLATYAVAQDKIEYFCELTDDSSSLRTDIATITVTGALEPDAVKLTVKGSEVVDWDLSVGRDIKVAGNTKTSTAEVTDTATVSNLIVQDSVNIVPESIVWNEKQVKVCDSFDTDWVRV